MVYPRPDAYLRAKPWRIHVTAGDQIDRQARPATDAIPESQGRGAAIMVIEVFARACPASPPQKTRLHSTAPAINCGHGTRQRPVANLHGESPGTAPPAGW
jgi:hypothetical protein